jgi:hypothetical protein
MCSPLIASLLYGVRPIDPMVFLSVPLVFLVVAFLASFIPARRPLRVDPIVALKETSLLFSPESVPPRGSLTGASEHTTLECGGLPPLSSIFA